jgi:hypothetical protein
MIHATFWSAVLYHEWHFRRENGHWYSWSTEQNVTSH